MESIRAVSREEILRYLGHRGQELSNDFLSELDACEQRMRSVVRPASVARVFERADTPDGIGLGGCKLVLPGIDIQNHLVGCGKIVLFAATLSAEADRLIASVRIESMTRSFLLDAVADALIEQVCDEVERKIIANHPTLHATWRFSPGYGDFPVTLQNQVLTVLDAPRRIGLCATETSLLTPRKSVTAVIGLSEQELSPKRRGCETCQLRGTCIYRKRGDRCDR